MKKFEAITGIAASLPISNVDTDKIIPKQFLKTIKRTGLGKGLFYELRFLPDGSDNPEFVLNQPPFDKAIILLSLENFGCGSSREHAPWALMDFGIRCVIAPSFADIFYNNCLENGLLPVTLDVRSVNELMDDASHATGPASGEFTIDLPKQVIIPPRSDPVSFDILPADKKRLLEGTDSIAQTLESSARIDAFSSKYLSANPWI